MQENQDVILPYKNPDISAEGRALDLLGRMTLDEKVAQVNCILRNVAPVDESLNFSWEKAKELLPDGIGFIGYPTNLGKTGGEGYIPKPADEMANSAPSNVRPLEGAKIINDIQRYFVEGTRLGIPVLFHIEALHGVGDQDGLCLPQAIGLASTWDEGLIEQLFDATARETRARGIQHVLSPVVDVSRDPRWGRTEETYGEDSYLISRIALAAVKGLQGTNPDDYKEKVCATLKHFAAYGASEGGRNCGPVYLSERLLREVVLPPFELAVTEGKVMAVMPAYNSIDGIPCHANKWLLDKVLREEWKFEGIVVSDYIGIVRLHSEHRIAADTGEAAAIALSAGVDVELPDPITFITVKEQIEAGKLDEKILDKAVYRILLVKFRLGLFEKPYVDPQYAHEICNCEKHKSLALKAAHESMVLLKNEAGLLPLSRKKIKRLAVIGPNAADCHIGGYGGYPQYGIDVLTGIRDRAGKDMEIKYAEGCRITKNRGAGSWFSKVELGDRDENLIRINEAVRVAEQCDAIVLVLGENEELCREGMDMHTLDLMSEQNELAQALLETGKPIAALLINGRALSINYLAEKIPAIIECWYLGQETGHAVADVLFGDVCPGGKLPVSIPRHVGTLPVYYNRKDACKESYGFIDSKPLFPFGFGRSYSEFRYAKLSMSKSEYTLMEVNGNEITVKVDITNIGCCKADEIAQLYLCDVYSSVERPGMELKGFKRISLNPGQTETIEFKLGFRELCFYNENMERVVEAGEFKAMVGTNSVDFLTVSFKVI